MKYSTYSFLGESSKISFINKDNSTYEYGDVLLFDSKDLAERFIFDSLAQEGQYPYVGDDGQCYYIVQEVYVNEIKNIS